MSHIPKVLGAFTRLLSYPDQHVGQAAELLFVVLQDEIPAAGRELSQFGAFLEQHELADVEEAFTRTFDVNPACALEVGWHLFGEEYARGMFLVRMREELRKYGLAESTELPDHVSHVLAVVDAMPAEESARFVQACVQPALEKMNDALAAGDSPYRHVMAGLVLVVREIWGQHEHTRAVQILESRRPDVDLLHAFPVADVHQEASCGGCCGADVELVPLSIEKPAPTDQAAANHEWEDRP